MSRHLAHEQEQELRREVELLQLVTSPAPAEGHPGHPVSQQWLEAAMMTRKPSMVRPPPSHLLARPVLQDLSVDNNSANGPSPHHPGLLEL